jgi:hypothetical protein
MVACYLSLQCPSRPMSGGPSLAFASSMYYSVHPGLYREGWYLSTKPCVWSLCILDIINSNFICGSEFISYNGRGGAARSKSVVGIVRIGYDVRIGL